MKTGFVYHDFYLEHKTGPGHPERPERLSHLITHLKNSPVWNSLIRIEPDKADIRWVETIHPSSYIESIKNACDPVQLNYLDSDTVVSEHSYDVALFAVGGALKACDAVMQGKVDNAFCAIRPPGHHAEPARAMGFCLFNNVAIAARFLQQAYGLSKICIIDWDVHHGNGTQNAFYEDPTVFYISVHQHPLYPGTGRADERGKGAGEGTTLNFPSPPGYGDAEYIRIFEEKIVPAVQNFAPDFILISAGFDAHKDDPLANMEVTEHGFAQMTRVIRALAQEICQGHLVALLEGGYNLEALARSVENHLKELQN